MLRQERERCPARPGRTETVPPRGKQDPLRHRPDDCAVQPRDLLRLWRARVGADCLDDHYDAAPVLVGVDPAALLADITCVHRTMRLWDGDDRGEPLTPAEGAARQVEAADA
ncbi:hypothetical protein ACFWSF_02905 [Streptomyces sp. NPDC058611]|uniref:hypothetical protein n=1 Tax=unclassified Streptomyces TaxID=2593676 RepID=UPI0036509910